MAVCSGPLADTEKKNVNTTLNSENTNKKSKYERHATKLINKLINSSTTQFSSYTPEKLF